MILTARIITVMLGKHGFSVPVIPSIVIDWTSKEKGAFSLSLFTYLFNNLFISVWNNAYLSFSVR
jgi:hypothetical protein